MNREFTYNYGKLRGKIREVYGSEKAFALDLGTTDTAMSLILNNKAQFRQDQIKRSCTLLKITPTKIGEYFFCEES